MLMSRLKRLQPGNRVRRVYQFRGLEFRLVAQGHLGTGPLAGFILTNLNDQIKNDLANTEHPDLLAVSFMQNIQFDRKPR